MDNSSIEAFSRNKPSERWTISCGRAMILTLARLYFVGSRMVVGITFKDPVLVRIVFLESSTSIQGIKLAFPKRGLESLSNCARDELT